MITRRNLLATLSTLLTGTSSPTPDASSKASDTVQPGNPIVGGTVLRIPAIQSPNFVTGTSGWSINQDGTAEFNGLIVHGTVILGIGSNNVIIMDFTRRAIFVYDAGGNLVISLAPTGGTDSLGNTYQSGVVSYLPGTLTQYSQLINGLLRLTSPNATSAAGGTIQERDVLGPGANQTGLDLASGLAAGNGAKIQIIGQGAGGVGVPQIWSFETGASANIDWAHAGNVRWMDPTTMTVEGWHALPLAANWANQGAPFANGSYRRTNGDTVQLGGAISWTAAAANAPVQITTALPAAYRPTSQHRLIVGSMPPVTVTPQIESIDVKTDGTLWITSFANGIGPVTPISLSGLEYPLDL